MLTVCVATARANCDEKPREVGLGSANILIKSYTCRAGRDADAAQIKVEFHRLSHGLAALVAAGASTEQMTHLLGKPRILKNEVLATYTDLLARFGETRDAQNYARLSVTAAGNGGSASVQDVAPEAVRMLGGNRYFLGYPAIAEITALMQGRIPPNVNFHYDVSCADAPMVGYAETCRNYSQVEMRLWRGLQRADFSNFDSNIERYNRLARNLKGGDFDRRLHGIEPADMLRAPFRLLQFMAGNNWPENFLIIEGKRTVHDKTVEWDFELIERSNILDVAVIENASQRPIDITGLSTTRAATTGLRPAASPSGPSQLVPLSQTLAPGERVLVPLRISFAGFADRYHFRQTANEILRQRGTSGLRGDVAAHRTPPSGAYAFGPELNLTGIQVDGRAIALARRSANFADNTRAEERGTCPFLLSWSEREGEWVNHGEVIHRASGREREGSETRVFPGFRGRFRLEEREPEIAFVDHAELGVTMKNGETLILAPDQPKLATRDGDYLALFFGEALTFEFALPEHVKIEDVIESRLTITGYYERYAALLKAHATGGGDTRRPERLP